MAKRKKSKKATSKKKANKKVEKPEKDESKDSKGTPDQFWSQAGAIGLIVLAILLFFGSFGGGGPLAETLFDWSQWLLGSIAYVLPFLIIFASVTKLRSDGAKLPRQVFWGFVVLFLAVCGFAHLFVDRAESLQAVEDGVGGGIIGHIVATGILGALNKVTGGIVLFFVALVALHFVFKLPLNHFLNATKLTKKEDDKKDSEAPKLEKKQQEFQLNEGVPLQKGAAAKVAKEATENQEALTTIGDPEWNFPSLDLLNDKQDKADAGDIEGNAQIIKETMADFNIEVNMQGANVGPRVTQYTLSPPNGVRLTKITALENNLALNLAATSIRMEAPIPGKRAVGIEVPNQKTATVRLHSLLDSEEWKKMKKPLSIAIGKDISGKPIIYDLNSMPHVLIAGATGSGKSVMINSLLTSLLYRNSPSDMKLILVDPKEVELSPYNDIPHLLTQVITDPTKCISALKWATAEMDRRYSLLREAGKRDIQGYNALKKEEGMPYIVIVIDELADLMMLAARDVEALIVRIAQKARAVGIHLVLATQRPSVDVITGLIKANVPARLAFTVTSQVDSRTIIDQGGAEKLLGKGDMLLKTQDTPKPFRVQGAIVEDSEVGKVTDFIRLERAPEYDDEIVSQQVNIGGGRGTVVGSGGDTDDSLYEDAVQVVLDSGKASTSLLQRRLRIGYSRAARLIEGLEEQGIIGPADGSRPREVLITSMQDIGINENQQDALVDDTDE